MASWSTGFCDCFSDLSSCCLTLWCPCVAFGRVAEIVDKGTTSCCVHGLLYCLLGSVGLGSLYGCIYRTKLRNVFGIDGSQTSDCLASCCCFPISLCQEHRELEARGFDMSAGWNGNVQMGSRGVTAAPAVQGGMSR
ncbi:protein PLANT CADMIUM RESISTANCE 3-like [Vicia villosa]|uniref:protein PLANT CADMIUM RESISTANCE 3-like n=1 Tax=Vicia villosa TaxID=3911 RepID=UPI00273AEE57|nr:protein PLANT CADMIUM RESISTANCE 3-like [Vicia villosa]XP_058772274.1 protein PLANT CADMIUM RESISTANCE 3-like [Vicia villosa]